MKNALQTLPATQSMSSVDVVAIINSHRDAGKPELQHKHFLEKVKKVIGEPAEKMAGQYKAGNGQLQPCFYLPKRECQLMVMSESYKVQAGVYDKLTEMEEATKSALPSNYVEALEALIVSEKSKQKALATVEVKDKLLIASNEASIKAGEVMVREFVKTNDLIDIGEKLFYQWMRDQNIIMQHKEPYQKFVNLGYFHWKPSSEEYGGKIRHQFYITPRGKVWLAAKYMAFLDRDMAA